MAFMITAQCINCSACEMDCPVRAIGRGRARYEIDPEVCVECAGYFEVPRCSHVCPVDACVPARADHLWRAAALINRGSPPVVLTRQHPHGRVLATTP
jgi:ferredoxin